MSRTPARERYDAVVDLWPSSGRPADFAYGLVKLTYTITERGLAPAPPEPLFHDIRDPDLVPRLLPGSDFWPEKIATDIGVLGSAHASRPVTHTRVSVTVGNTAKRIDVWGRRVIEWRGTTPKFSAPEPFEEMAMTNANAYGGFDGRVPMPKPKSIADEVIQQWDHPGVYPRNPFGKGYLVQPDPVEGVELPNLEDPDDPLTPERIIVRDPKWWWRQPLPWSLDWHHPMMFPRYVFAGADAWHPAPQDETLTEVRRGWLPAGYRRRYPEDAPLSGDPPPMEFCQDASLGMSFRELQPGTPLSIRGMHPLGKTLQFTLPEPPLVDLAVEKKVERIRPFLSTVLIEPSDDRVCLTYVARLQPLPRVFIPGLHGKIPLVMRVGQDAPLQYETPPTVRSQSSPA